jgi:hypothetical protein
VAILRVHPPLLNERNTRPSIPRRGALREPKGALRSRINQRRSLQIRWDTGEVANTSVDPQAKILRNMEKELTDVAAQWNVRHAER